MESPSPLVVSVRRHKPELVVPEKSTPREIKPLSDIDDQEGLRFQIPFIMFYGHNPSMETKDPVKIIRQALARTLVFYYPLAGRLIEGPNRKLMVDCNGQGVLFIEGDSDVRLDQLGNMVLPRCPYLEELLYDVPGTGGIIGCPLLLFHKVDFGWGKPIYGGPATAISLISLYAKFKNSQGEDGIVLLICMPLPAMERFLQELEKMTQEVVKDSYDTNPIKVMSRL